jgi:hypothetical protein
MPLEARPKFEPMCDRLVADYVKECRLTKRATNGHQTEARELSLSCPYTFLSTAVGFDLLAQLHGQKSPFTDESKGFFLI